MNLVIKEGEFSPFINADFGRYMVPDYPDDGETFNVVDDDLPSSRRFLKLYKRNVRRFPSVYVPHAISYLLCGFWEWYSAWSEGQLPPVFNRRSWHAYWGAPLYSNAKLKTRIGWAPSISTDEGLRRYFASCQKVARA